MADPESLVIQAATNINSEVHPKRWHQKYASSTKFVFSQVFMYFVLTYAWTWSIWWSIAAIMYFYQSLNYWYVFPVGLLASCGPLFASLVLTYKYEGGISAIKKFLKRGFKFKTIPISVYYGSVLTYLLIDLITSYIVGAKINYTGLAMFVPSFFLMYFGGALQEEYGWRGYALDRIQQKFNSFISSIIIGIIWAFWHLPLFFIRGDPHQNMYFWYFVLEVITSSMIITWLYNQSQSNITVAMLCHMAMNSSMMPFHTDSDDTDTDIPYDLCKGIVAVVVILFVIVPIFGYKTFTKNNMYKNSNIQDVNAAVE